MTDEETAAQILEREDERCRAVTSMDLDALDALLADDMSYIHSSGVLQDKATYLAGLGNRRRNLTGRDRTVRVYGDTAVLTGTLTIGLSEDGEAPRTAEIRTQQVWVRGPSGWKQVAASQAGPLKAP